MCGIAQRRYSARRDPSLVNEQQFNEAEGPVVSGLHLHEVAGIDAEPEQAAHPAGSGDVGVAHSDIDRPNVRREEQVRERCPHLRGVAEVEDRRLLLSDDV